MHVLRFLSRPGVVSVILACLAAPLAARSSHAAVDGAWAEIITGPQSDRGAVLDSVRNRMVVFDGHAVWALALTGSPVWTRIEAAGAPPPVRTGHSTIYDAAHQRLVVFGGSHEISDVHTDSFDDVWALSLDGAPAWTRLEPAGAPTDSGPARPGAREGHCAIYDAAHERMIVFGGYVGVSPWYRKDVWSLSLADSDTIAWSQLSPAGTGPDERKDASAIYDPLRQRMILFAGFAGLWPSYRADLWELSLGETPVWTQLSPAGMPPHDRGGHSAIYDPAEDRMVVFGGYWYDGSSHWLDDTWSLALGTPGWTQISLGLAPYARCLHGAICDGARGRMVVYGGRDASRYRTDVWALTLAPPPGWTCLAQEIPTPGARAGQSVTLDPVRDRLLVFGGATESAVFGDLWALSLSGAPRWTSIAQGATRPEARWGHAAIYDPARDRLLVFGGDSLGVLHNDLWALSLADPPSWTALVPSGSAPEARTCQSAVLDAKRDRVVLFGGQGRFAPLHDVWALSLATPAWTPLAPGGAGPAARCRHVAVCDSAHDRMVIFGGYGTNILNDTWSLTLADPPAWSQVVTADTLPPAGDGVCGILDVSRGRLVVFGGISSTGGLSNGVWALSLGADPAWQELSCIGSMPIARVGAGGVYDSARDRMLVLGGEIMAGMLGDTWSFTFADTTTAVLVSLASAAALPGRIDLVWQLGASVRVTVQRREETTAWCDVASAYPDGAGQVAWSDRDVTPGARYGYRLGLVEDDVERFAGETWIEVPRGLVFALAGAQPNPCDGRLRVSFTLPAEAPATLEVLDVAGRRVAAREVGSLGAGRHLVALTAGRRLPAGLFVLRLTQAGRTLTAKAVVVPRGAP